MGFDWKDVAKIGIQAASIALPGGIIKDTVLANVTAIIEDEKADNTDATKVTAAAVDALAKEVKKLRTEVDELKKQRK